MAIKASNQTTLVDLTDAYSVILTSDAYTFVGNTMGAPSGLSCATQVLAYCGTTQCPKVNVTVSCPTGISATITNNDTPMPTVTFRTTATVSSACQATITVAVDGLTINKKFSFAVAKTGATGATGPTGSAGKGIKSTAVTYQDCPSGTAAPTGTWTSSPPVTSADKPYLWSKTVITYTDGTISTTYSVGSTPEGIVVGGRNLFLNTDKVFSNNDYNIAYYEPANAPLVSGETYTATICITPAFGISYIGLYFSGGNFCPAHFYVNGTEKQVISKTFTMAYKPGMTPEDGIGYAHVKFYRFPNDGTVTADSTMHWVKIEKGNKATDWTPAPEDMASFDDVQNAQKAADNAQQKADDAANLANSTENRVAISEAQIKALNDMIKSIVTDANGSTLMTQTSTGWTFNISGIEKRVSDAVGVLNNLAGDVMEAENVISNLNTTINDVIKKTAYIIMTTDDSGAPCIELGKEGNPFKVRITNTAVDFMQGTFKIAYISNNSLYIEKAVVKNELQIGDGHGFVWKKRASGNLGLRWV